MNDELIQYPFNPQGNLKAAWVPEEAVTVRTATGDGYNFVVPKNAPFFRNEFKLFKAGNTTPLVEGVDFILTHPFRAMSALTGLEIFGSFMMIDRTFTGNLQINYFTLGGEFVLDEAQMLTMLANKLFNPRITFWERVAEVPAVFPPISHQHNIATDTMGWDDVVAAINGLKQPMEEGYNKAMAAVAKHEARKDNPHGVTKEQLQLGLVQNFRLATMADIDSTGANLYMTLEVTRAFINKLAMDDVNAHISNRANPHNVTKAQVQLGSVNNYGTATPAETITGTSSALYVTPAGVKAAIEAGLSGTTGDVNAVSNRLTNHVNDEANPHNVTKAQVELGSVLNYGVATTAEATVGTVNNKYMTPSLTAAAITSQVGTKLNSHVDNKTNPHGVTKGQVGLGNVLNYGVADASATVAGVITTLYTTPFGVNAAIKSLAVDPMNLHVNNKTNPHNVTKAQVGLGNVQNYGVANTDEALSGSSNALYMTPVTVHEVVNSIARSMVDAHTANKANPHNVTKAQVGLGNVLNYGVATQAEAEAGVATDKYMTPALVAFVVNKIQSGTIAGHISDTTNPHNVTKAQVGLGNVPNFGAASNTDAINQNDAGHFMTPQATYIAIQKFSALPGHTHTAAQVGALPISGGTLTGDLGVRTITGTGGLTIDGQAGTIRGTLISSSGEITSLGAIRGENLVAQDEDSVFVATVDYTGEVTGSAWINPSSKEPVEDPTDPWGTDASGNKIKPSKVGSLKDWLNSTYITGMATVPAFDTLFNTKFDTRWNTKYNTSFDARWDTKFNPAFDARFKTNYDARFSTDFTTAYEARYRNDFTKEFNSAFPGAFNANWNIKFGESFNTHFNSVHPPAFDARFPNSFDIRWNNKWKTEFDKSFQAAIDAYMAKFDIAAYLQGGAEVTLTKQANGKYLIAFGGAMNRDMVGSGDISFEYKG